MSQRGSACEAEIDKALSRITFAKVSYDRYPTAGELRDYLETLVDELQRLHNKAYLSDSFLAQSRIRFRETVPRSEPRAASDRKTTSQGSR
jgi:hypothetical protein